jgi:hypothetical protein
MCEPPQPCEANNCAGDWDSNGQATCKKSFAGCQCVPTPKTCGDLQPCDLHDCRGDFDPDGQATCKGAFAGCQCSPTATNCGERKSCDDNNCQGSFNSNGQATCKGAFATCRCNPTDKTCFPQKPCGDEGCAGAIKGGVATCQGNFAGCKCTAGASTPGFCTNLASCQFADCAGKIVNPGSNVGICQGGTHKGCPCSPNAQTPGFCGAVQSCDINGCKGTQVGAGSSFGTCQAGSLVGCTCLFQQSPPPNPGGGGGGSNCQADCLTILTEKVNGLPNQICTDDSSNNWIDSGSAPSGFTDWWRLASHNNCFLVLAKQSGSGSLPDGYCFPKSFLQGWVASNALGCNSGDEFFRPSQPLLPENQFTGAGIVCLSNFLNYQLCGSSTKNGGTDFGKGGGVKPPR